MKVFWIALTIFNLLSAVIIYSYVNADLTQALYEPCPDGFYSIGDSCKKEPTGCPYGENTPVDSIKCKPDKTYQTKVQYDIIQLK